LNHTPFAQTSTPQQAGRRTSTHWPLTSLAQQPCGVEKPQSVVKNHTLQLGDHW
jgi:hypothetical protein